MGIKRLRWLLPLLLVLLSPALARAQTYLPIQGWCMDGAKYAVFSGLNSTNEVQASYPQCTVTVALHGGGGATIYSNSSGGALTNPFTSQLNGQWTFYVDAALALHYDVTLSGGTPDAFPIPVVYYSDIQPPGGGGSGGGSVKPSATDGIVFVTREGNDTNDCLSWGSACLTLLGGYNKLNAGGGTIYVTSGDQFDGPACTPTGGQGLGIAGTADPNYSSMPTAIGSVYWVKAKGGFSGVTIQGVSADASGQNATTGALTPVLCGGDTAPAFQFSYTQGITLQNLSMAYPKQGILLAVDSNGSAVGNLGSSSNFNFVNVSINICNSCGATPGPAIWIGGNTLWVNMYNLALQGNAGNATVDGRAAILVETGGGGMALASGLIHMQHINSTGGGNFVMEPDWDSGTGGFDIDDWTMEGSGVATPLVYVGDGGAIFGADIQRITMSDSASAPWVHIPSTVSPFFVHVHPPLGQDAVTLDGPMDVIGEMRIGGINAVAMVGGAAVPSIAPQAFHEVGYPLGRLAGVQTDVDRRTFEAFARFTNLAVQDTSTWTPVDGTSHVTTGQAGPDGTTHAAKVSTTSSMQGEGAYVYSATINWQPGDYYYIGVWARAASTNGVNAGQIVNSELCLCFPFGGGPTTKLIAGSYLANAGSVLGATASPQTDGEWQWLWAVGKAVAGFGNATTRLEVHSPDSTKPMYYENPVFARIPASTLALVAAPTFSTGTESGNVVTMGTSGAHGLSPSEPIVISGCTPTGYNGEVTIISTPLTTSFTYYSTTSGMGSASGCIITPGNDSEAADWGQNTTGWSDGAPANTIAAPRGVLTSFSGSGSFWGTLTQANTANRTYTFPDVSGNLCNDGQSTCFQQSFQGNDGSAAVPTYSFLSAPSSGMYRIVNQVCVSLVATSQYCTNNGPGLTSAGTLCVTTDTRCISSKTATTSLAHYMGVTGGAIMFALPLDASNPVTTGWATGEEGGLYYNTTTHVPRFWNGTLLEDFGAPVFNSTGTTQTASHIVIGTCTLGTSCVVTLTGASVFTGAASYVCTAVDQTAAAAVKIVQASGSAFTLTGTGTDILQYTCVGN
jgi:hypothetical protein